jgi:DNA replication licensing factor MCM2
LSKYINHNRDANDLLLHTLQSLVRDEIRFYQYVHGRDPDTISVPETVEVDVEDLQMKARELGVYDLSEFLGSKSFKDAGFSVQGAGKRICKSLRVE